MAKQYADMKTHVGKFVLDTSTAMASLIGDWLNDYYRDISRRSTWSWLINFDYTFPTVIGTGTYNVPADFEQEIFLANITDGTELTCYNEGLWFKERYNQYTAGTLQRGTPTNYIILREAGQIFLDNVPDAVKTMAMPYKKVITDLSGDTDVVAIRDIERIMEYGAISEALAYKKQYEKANYYLQKYEDELMKRIGQDKARRNLAFQRISQGYHVRPNGRLLGNNSYDTI